MKRAATAFSVCLAAVVMLHCSSEPSPTVPSPPYSAPSTQVTGSGFGACRPTPLDSTSPIAGCWNGTFDTSDPADCHTNTPATATFIQDGPNVTGTLSADNACGLIVSVVGVLVGDHLE